MLNNNDNILNFNFENEGSNKINQSQKSNGNEIDLFNFDKLLNQVNNSSSYQEKSDDLFSNFLENNIGQSTNYNDALFNFELSDTNNTQ